MGGKDWPVNQPMRESRETDHRLFAPSSFHWLLVGEPRRKAFSKAISRQWSSRGPQPTCSSEAGNLSSSGQVLLQLHKLLSSSIKPPRIVRHTSWTRIDPSCSYRLGVDVVEEYQSGKIALSGRGQEDIMVVAVLNWSTHPLDINVPPLHPFQMDPADIV